jgi:putative transcriptional regulator
VAAEVDALSRIGRPLRAAAFAAFAAFCSAGWAATTADDPAPATGAGLAGQFLIATPSIGDPRFAGTVIYMVRHNASGAFGLVVNRALGTTSAAKLLKDNGVAVEGEGSVRVYYGGPVERETGWIVHTPDRRLDTSIVVSPTVAVTRDPALLKEIAAGSGPRRHFIAFGYAGWGPGQLEGELRQRAWATAPAEERILYDDDMDTKWGRAMERRGIPL